GDFNNTSASDLYPKIRCLQIFVMYLKMKYDLLRIDFGIMVGIAVRKREPTTKQAYPYSHYLHIPHSHHYEII
ncbi:hypothetical protein, partial [Bacteroides acidifaciens]